MGLEMRAFEETDRGPLLAALAGATGRPPEDLAAEFAWLQANPAGARTFVAMRAGRLVAHLSAAPRRVWIKGGEHRFAELLGAWVAPDEQRGLAHEGVYVRLAKALFAAHQGADGDFVYHLVPTREERRVGAKLLGFKPVTTLPLLRLEVEEVAAGGDGPDTSSSAGTLETIERFDEQARWLWERCSGAFGASAIRDDVFLNHRFFERPGHAYRVLGVRDGEGILRGYAVVRPGASADLYLCDWLVPPDEPVVGEQLARAVVQVALAKGARAIVGFVPEWSPWFAAFQGWGYRVVPSKRFVFARGTARRYDAHWLHTQWWHTLADTIFDAGPCAVPLAVEA